MREGAKNSHPIANQAPNLQRLNSESGQVCWVTPLSKAEPTHFRNRVIGMLGCAKVCTPCVRILAHGLLKPPQIRVERGWKQLYIFKSEFGEKSFDLGIRRLLG